MSLILPDIIQIWLLTRRLVIGLHVLWLSAQAISARGLVLSKTRNMLLINYGFPLAFLLYTEHYGQWYNTLVGER